MDIDRPKVANSWRASYRRVNLMRTITLCCLLLISFSTSQIKSEVSLFMRRYSLPSRGFMCRE